MKGITTVRAAEAADSPPLYRAWQTLREYNAGLDSRIRLVPVSESEFATGLDATILRASAAAFVAERDGALIGFATCNLEAGASDRLPERHATVGYFFVEPPARRSGVGRQLFAAMTLWAKTQDGVLHLEMPVLANDAEAVAFWTALGFQPFIQRLWAPLDGGHGS